MVVVKPFVVEQGPNPSSDFFISPALVGSLTEIKHFGFNDIPQVPDLDDATVIFVRYVPPKWKAFLDSHPGRVGKIVFFMDDDLFDVRAFAGLPRRYQWKLCSRAWRHQRWLKSVNAELWVSSARLAEKYVQWQPRLLEPQNPHKLYGFPPSAGAKTLFYHGSASHRAELEWLVPVVERVMADCSDLVFEVIGDQRVRDRFSQVPRVNVLHSMSWPNYQALLQRPGRTIGLAPLLDSPFNVARAPTKFFDITATGAVGIYAHGPVYDRRVKHGINGLLLPMNSQRVWAEEIVQLVSDEAFHAQLLAAAREDLGANHRETLL